MNDLSELIEAYREQTLALDELYSAVTLRGACSEEEHRIELAWLARMRDDGTLEPAVASALRQRLHCVQDAAPAEAGGRVDDATRIQPASPSLPSLPGSDIQTVIQFSGDGFPPSLEDGVTVVKPYAPMAAPIEAANDAAVLPPQGERATVGMLLKERFLLERELGRGGMGVVYLARDERKVEARDRDPHVAVKVLNDEFRRHPDSLVALQREARRAQQLGHENIVRVYDFDKHGDIVFMTMEYIDGNDLRSLIREHVIRGLDLQQAWPLIEGMARGLQCAHEHGVVHSDFKPGNVMINRAGVPKVFDFGIARASKFAGDHAGDQTVFDAGALNALTPAYASLDMTQGKQPQPNDDIYALGCVIFELLSGRHPFGKLSAETAMRDGMQPPPLPALSKRQYKTLRDSVAFDSARRPPSVGALIDGLRHRSVRERLGPYLLVLSGALLILFLAMGGWGFSGYLQRHRIDAVAANFSLKGAHALTDEKQVLSALETLNDEQRKRFVLDHSEQIQAFLLGRMDSYWNVEQGRIDYAGVKRILALRDRLKLFSPALDARMAAIEQQRNDLLNNLDTRLSIAVQSGAIFQDRPGNAAELLGRIRTLDPASALLKNKELELKYAAAIAESIEGRRLKQARQRLTLASQLFPEAQELQLYRQQLDAFSEALPAVAGPAASTMSPLEARRALKALEARPEATSAWQDSVASAMTTLHDSTGGYAPADIDALSAAIIAYAARTDDALQAQQALALVATGLRYAPRSAPLLTEQKRLEALQRQRQQKLDQDMTNAAVSSRIESVRRAVAANNVAKAQRLLGQIRRLKASEPFLSVEGPQLLSGAYLARARKEAMQGHWKAAALAAKGMDNLGPRPELRAANERYALMQALVDAAKPDHPIDKAEYQQLEKRYQAVEQNDQPGLTRLRKDIEAGDLLPQHSLEQLLKQLREKSAARPVADTAIVGQRPSVTSAHGKATAQGKDPCRGSALRDSGKICVDTLSDGSRGPDLLVMTGKDHGAAYAITRTPISAEEFKHYCRVVHCASTQADSPNGQAQRIYLSQAHLYAKWLTRMTGYSYHLQSDVGSLRLIRDLK